MIKFLWLVAYAHACLLVLACGGSIVLAFILGFSVSPWFFIGVPVGLTLTVGSIYLAGWTIEKALDAERSFR